MEPLFDLDAHRLPRTIPVLGTATLTLRVPDPDELVGVYADTRAALVGRELPDQTAVDQARQVAMARAVGRLCITGWTGVGIGGLPAPVTPDTVDAVLGIDAVLRAIYRDFVAPVILVPEAEGNASTPAPDGTSGAGSATAGAVPTTEAPAHGDSPSADGSVPTGNTGR